MKPKILLIYYIVVLYRWAKSCMDLPELPQYRWDEYREFRWGSYKFPPEESTFEHAKSDCEKDNGSLIVFDSERELKSILRVLTAGDRISVYSPVAYDFWIGAKKDGDKWYTLEGNEIDFENGPVTWFSENDAGASTNNNNDSSLLRSSDELIFRPKRDAERDLLNTTQTNDSFSRYHEDANKSLINNSILQVNNWFLDDEVGVLENRMGDVLLRTDGNGSDSSGNNCIFFLCFTSDEYPYGYVSEDCNENHYWICEKKLDPEPESATRVDAVLGIVLSITIYIIRFL